MSAEFFEKSYDDKYMCISQQVKEPWRSEYPFITSNDGTGRSQCVNAQNNSDLYKLLTHFQEKSGHGVLMNTALSRPGEALVCSPDDALNMFMGTDLEYLIMQDILVTKREETSNW
jgi:carbamoyltransferase